MAGLSKEPRGFFSAEAFSILQKTEGRRCGRRGGFAQAGIKKSGGICVFSLPVGQR
jgi:hypothetical protein